MFSPLRIALLAVGCGCWLGAAVFGADSDALSRAAGLFKNRQYNDVIRVLAEAVKGRSEAECAREYLLLGEALYLTRQYEPARGAFTHAARHLSGKDKLTAEYRLACAWYRLGNFEKATEQIDSFVRQHPQDERVGKLHAYQMLILAKQGKPAEQQLEALHQKIQANLAKYDFTTGMEADEILCDFYRKTQQPDKAQAVYARIVNNFRQVAAEYDRDNRPLPAALKTSHDHAALQLGLLALERKNSAEAIKWFENIRFDRDLQQKARLHMAKLAYERQDFNSAIRYLTVEGFLETVPAGPVKADMCLILGLARLRTNSGVGEIEAALRQVPAEARGFAQAQLALANLYREKKLADFALKAYQNAAASPDYAAIALLNIGEINLEKADRAGADTGTAQALYQQAGAAFTQLFAKYPLSAEAKQAKPHLDKLAAKGVVVSSADSESSLKAWEKLAREKPGSVEAAQALMSLARHHFKRIVDERTEKLLRAPDYRAAAAACDQLLDAKLYNGQGWSESDWRAFQCEVLYTRSQCELASLAPPAPKPGEPTIGYLNNASPSRAVDWLQAAAKLVQAKQLDLVRSLEISLVEALFKSERPADKNLAEKRFAELENNYGNDPRLQRLSLELADWYAEQKRFADAGRMLAGVASRGKDLPQADLLKILFNAGVLYSRAGQAASEKTGETGFWIRISPKTTIDLAGTDLLKVYPPLQRTVTMKWPRGGADLSAGEALLALSQTAQVPFTWARSDAEGSVGAYLQKKRVTLQEGPTTAARALAAILQTNQHQLAFAIGLTDGTPTLPRPADKDDPAAETWRLLEIYNKQRLDLYYRPATAPFGSFHDQFGNRPTLLYSILQKIEERSQMRVVWAEGIDKQEKLAHEFREFPGVRSDYNANCLQVLNSVLDSLGLRWELVARNVATEYYEAAKEQFNRLRQIDPKSKFGERALLTVALNFHALQDYAKMKAILREYLKVFDNPDNENRHMAAYWIGWVFEKENNFREAGNYYARAAEERLVVYKVPADSQPPSRDQLKKQLGYQTQAALLEPATGELVDKPLSALLEFVTINAHLEVRLDSSAQGVAATLQRPAFKNTPIFDLFCDGLEQLGLSFRVENVNAEYAERAYFRQVVALRRDNAMPQALEAAQTLLARFPQTTRRREVYGLMLDIHKGLKDYRQVLSTMEQLQAITTEPAEKQKLANEIAWIYFDMADYPRAQKAFDTCLASAQDPQDRLELREGFARAAQRAKQPAAALAAYQSLLKEDPRPLRQFRHRLNAYIILLETGQADERDLPKEAENHLVAYEQLTAALRARLAPEDIAKATWVYYALAKRDLKKGYLDEAIKKLNACANSTDDNLAAEALFELGAIHMLQNPPNYNAARDVLEELLFRGKGTDALVRGTFALGTCYQQLGRPEKAREKFQQLLDRYPLSPLVAEVMKNPLFAAKESRD